MGEDVDVDVDDKSENGDCVSIPTVTKKDNINDMTKKQTTASQLEHMMR